MKTSCPACYTVLEISPESAALIGAFFAKCQKDILILCDSCGLRVLRGYQDIYGIGI